MQSTDQELIHVLKAAVYDISLKELGDITPETRIPELGLDSVAVMELIGVLEEELSIRIPDEDVAALGTVGDLLQLIRRLSPSGLAAQIEIRDIKQTVATSKSSSLASECWNIADFPEVKNLESRLHEIARIGLENPYFRVHDGTAKNRSIIEGVEMLNFSSYNYLGFSGHPEVVAAAKEAIDRYGTSVSASRLVSGERPVHRELECGLAKHIGVEDAVVFVSGHATNVTTIGHLFDKNDLILHDSLCHDSILQGIYLSGAKRYSFPHASLEELEQALAQYRSQYRRALICTEGLFSMDGDICDLPGLVELKKRYQCNLIIDEAHSIGVLGPSGRGIAHHFPGIDPTDVDLWMGTLSKSFASCGGYIAGSKPLVHYLKYTAPGFLYSVGMPAPNAAAALKSLELMQRHPEIVEQLRQRSKLFLDLALSKGVNTGFSAGAAVIPAIIGNSNKSMRVSHAMAARRINVQPIVHPAVEENAARLRFFISATHTEEEIRQAVDVLAEELHAVGCL
ncbi:MAG TPA: aminotransferase class I/II-fold pyridoxal phosphate-dependent enzyme [Acidobacteriota bacterium]|nr:aminotransferase class I/II-fold pyridoxal phosphate-dependent enzyme [Acidobacteriota bacterium]